MMAVTMPLSGDTPEATAKAEELFGKAKEFVSSLDEQPVDGEVVQFEDAPEAPAEEAKEEEEPVIEGWGALERALDDNQKRYLKEALKGGNKCASIAKENGNDDKIRDAWGNAIRYRNPGKFNTGTYDLYSIGRDKAVGDAEDSTKKSPGLGDDIANFKNPKAN